MPGADSDNVAGHRAKYESLKAHFQREDVGMHFVGGSDPVWTGYYELECIRQFRSSVKGAFVTDIGCGIGRLTRHMLHEPIAGYMGLDIIPEIMQEAIDMARGDPRFSFHIAQNCRIPLPDAHADIVCAFSVITHLLDEEAFEYFVEARRVLRPGGLALFTFCDFMLPRHAEDFFHHAAHHRSGHGDIMKFTTKETLRLFATKAGFSACEFRDGTEELPISGAHSDLVVDEHRPKVFTMGQSVCAMSF